MRVLIDGDVLIYRSGFASQQSIYKVYLREDRDEFGPIASFHYKKEAVEWVGDSEDFVIEKEIEPEPLANCLHSIKITITSILNTLDASDYTIFLTGGNQFREKLATIRPYKGNRDPLHKPYWYNEIKDYLGKYWNAKTIEYYEADDALSMNQWQAFYTKCKGTWFDGTPISTEYCGTIICSIDKDLDQVPGWHFDFVKKEKYWITEDEALRWFYIQLISGDRVDNVQGVSGYGEAKARKIIGKCKDEKEMYEAAFKLYQQFYPNNSMEALMETAQLVYMVKQEGVQWSPPK